MIFDLFCISGKYADQLLVRVVSLWRNENSFERKMKKGVILYNKPPKNLFSIAHKKAEIHRHLCTAAYR